MHFKSFKVRSGVKKGLCPGTHYFAALFQHALDGKEDGIGSQRESKRLTTAVLSRELLFADAAAIMTHSEI